MRSNYKTSGFTLIELMIVVAIIGVLAAVAFTAYNAYIRRSYNAEATAMLSDIKVKQEAYRATFHQYANLDSDGWQPRSSFTPQSVTWSDPAPVTWRQLGIGTTGNLYFLYAGQAGAPGGTPDSEYTTANPGTKWCGQDFWYAAKALQNFDGGTNAEGFIVTSGDSRLVEYTESNP